MAGVDVETILAPNPGPMTLEGTNTYLVGRDPAIVIDPGPEDPGHIEAVRAAAEERGGIGAVLVTHSHEDHIGGVELLGVEPAKPADGEAVAWPDGARHPRSHRGPPLLPDAGRPCSAGDLILGEGSTIVPAGGPGRVAGQVHGLAASASRSSTSRCCSPGTGRVIDDPAAKIAEYIEHRESRQRRLTEALERGERSRMALLKEVWDDVPEPLLPAAAFAMQAHLEQLERRGRDRARASWPSDPASAPAAR